MNVGIIERWNNQVTDADTVYVIGDLAMGRTQETIPLAKELRGTKILVRGNHDKATARTYIEKGGFSSVLDSAFLTINGSGRQLQLCHFPFVGDSREDDRYRDRRPVDKGQWLLCGHVHDAWRQRGRAINVGIDAWGGNLVTEADLTTLIGEGPQDRGVLGWDIAAEDSAFAGLPGVRH